MLKKSLFLLGELTDEQVAWLLRAGNEQHLAPGGVLIQSGVPLDALSVIMAGTLSIQLENVAASLWKLLRSKRARSLAKCRSLILITFGYRDRCYRLYCLVDPKIPVAAKI